MRFFSYLFVLICISSARIVAQTNFSDAFYNISKSNHLLIPSNACIDNNFQYDFAYRTYFGKLSIIKSFYTDLNFNLRGKKSTHSHKVQKHILGFGAYKDEEGEFFSKFRFYPKYSLHLKLNDKLHLATGASIYLVNYSFDASLSGASGSDFTFTGCVSSTLYGEDFKIGAGMNDFNNATLRPISYDFVLNRFFTFYGEKLVDIKSDLQLKAATRINYSLAQQNSTILQAGLVFSDLACASAFYYHRKGFGLIFDIQKIDVLNSKLDCSFSVLAPNQKVQPNLNQFELNLHYYVPNKK